MMFFFKQKTAYEMRISDWSSDVCSSDLAVAGIIRRHILRPLARERAGELALVGEVVATVMELHPVAMPRQRHIGRMAVHAGGGEDMRPIDRHALRFMDGGGIALIYMGIIFQVERARSPVIEPTRHAAGRYAPDLPHRTKRRRVGHERLMIGKT